MSGLREAVEGTARGIGEYGMTAVSAAFFLVLAAGMMVAMFRMFRSMVDRCVSQQAEVARVLVAVGECNGALAKIAAALEPVTSLRVRNLSGFAFGLAVEQVCRLIKQVRAENHIADRAATGMKVRKLLRAIHEDRRSKFDPFLYGANSTPLSNFMDEAWIEEVAAVVEGELYNADGANDARAYTNVKLAYDNIKVAFYKNMNT